MKFWRNFQFSIFTSLTFEDIWLSYEKEISKFVGMVLMLNVSNKNIKKDFKCNNCMYFFIGHLVTPRVSQNYQYSLLMG